MLVGIEYSSDLLSSLIGSRRPYGQCRQVCSVVSYGIVGYGHRWRQEIFVRRITPSFARHVSDSIWLFGCLRTLQFSVQHDCLLSLDTTICLAILIGSWSPGGWRGTSSGDSGIWMITIKSAANVVTANANRRGRIARKVVSQFRLRVRRLVDFDH